MTRLLLCLPCSACVLPFSFISFFQNFTMLVRWLDSNDLRSEKSLYMYVVCLIVISWHLAAPVGIKFRYLQCLAGQAAPGILQFSFRMQCSCSALLTQFIKCSPTNNYASGHHQRLFYLNKKIEKHLRLLIRILNICM
jgi:hypothetical protein